MLLHGWVKCRGARGSYRTVLLYYSICTICFRDFQSNSLQFPYQAVRMLSPVLLFCICSVQNSFIHLISYMHSILLSSTLLLVFFHTTFALCPSISLLTRLMCNLKLWTKKRNLSCFPKFDEAIFHKIETQRPFFIFMFLGKICSLRY